MSSWLDNIAAHYEEEDEEDYESQPQIKQPQQPEPSQTPQEQPQPQQNDQPQQNTQPQLNSQPQQPDLQLKPKEEQKVLPTPTENSKESNQIVIENEPPKDKETNENKDKEKSEATKSPAYSGTITKEMQNLDKSINFLLKRQEFYYAGSMIKIRSSVDLALEKTSKPIQTIGGLGTVSLEAKGKYDALNKRIMKIQPLCAVTPKSK